MAARLQFCGVLGIDFFGKMTIFIVTNKAPNAWRFFCVHLKFSKQEIRLNVNDKAIQNFKNLCQSDERGAALLDALSHRDRCKHLTDVDYISDLTHLRQSEVQVLFADLERTGVGCYKKGNRWGKSRFQWFGSPVKIVKRVLMN